MPTTPRRQLAQLLTRLADDVGATRPKASHPAARSTSPRESDGGGAAAEERLAAGGRTHASPGRMKFDAAG
jgi:hypothetical protein